VRYQIMAHTMLGYLLLDLERCAEAADTLERGLGVGGRAKITYWTPLLHANLAIARARLGRLDVQADLEKALGHAQAQREGWFLTRCLEGLAEISLARGKTEQCIAYADELLRVAEHGKLREMMARAYRWRGEAFLAAKDYAAAASELHRAAERSAQLGRLRLSWDIHRALARLCHEENRTEEARNHRLQADSIAARIADNLRGSELKAALR
jgi:tetratricopeptide (TPR) repeat protein